MIPIGASQRAIRTAPAGDQIRESEADAKLLHRWYLSEDASPFVDQVGSVDGANNATTQVSGGWVDGAARNADGTDDYISFGPRLNGNHTNYALALSIKTTTSDLTTLFGANETFAGSQVQVLRINDNTGGDVRMIIGEGGGNSSFSFSTSGIGINDGNEYRIVINVIDATNNKGKIWVNQTDQNATADASQSPSDFRDFTRDFYAHAQNFQGSTVQYLDGVIDDICVFNTDLTQSEIQSYNNPWS